MVKAVHASNGHFDDESAFREVQLFALDQLLGANVSSFLSFHNDT